MPHRTASMRYSAVVLGMLSLSVGWGIRGNFGHEYGAMIAGALCAIAVSLCSGREDWRGRVLYFAVFGALGWGFGGSMSYMLPLGYTHSGHLPTQIYGFLATFLTGFLWASLGGAGTAYPAVEEQEKLTQLFKPIGWVLAVWAVHYFAEDHLARWYLAVQQGSESLTGDFRQKDPFYWLDSDWLEACLALVALALFDLWDRRFERFYALVLLGGLGALAGRLVQAALIHSGGMEPLLAAVVHPQGDVSAVNPATGLLFDPEELVLNWPQVFFDIGHHLGWILGLVGGAVLYFWRYGKWRWGASLLVHLALGGLLAFLIGPVLLSGALKSVGGFRLVPPRGDNWAMCLGVFLGMLVYMLRNRLVPVVFASIIAGMVGGLGLMAAQFLKILAFAQGSPLLTDDPAVRQAWAHWRSANWHSILTEQGVGLLYGLAIVVAMALLATRVGPLADRRAVGRWTQAFSVVFLLNLVVYVNLVKNVAEWTRQAPRGLGAMEPWMKPPLLDVGPYSAHAWFNLAFLLITLATVVLVAVHLRRPLAVVPSSWLGKGQMVYLIFLWVMVIGNFERALVGFRQQRLGTEGLILVNALLAMLLILCFPRREEPAPRLVSPPRYGRLTGWAVLGGLAVMLLCTALFTTAVRGIYGDRHDGWGGRNVRLGPEADWRMHPILRSAQHR